jgi:hypothetical protein
MKMKNSNDYRSLNNWLRRMLAAALILVMPGLMFGALGLGSFAPSAAAQDGTSQQQRNGDGSNQQKDDKGSEAKKAAKKNSNK